MNKQEMLALIKDKGLYIAKFNAGEEEIWLTDLKRPGVIRLVYANYFDATDDDTYDTLELVNVDEDHQIFKNCLSVTLLYPIELIDED